jgi:hypothetical protein
MRRQEVTPLVLAGMKEKELEVGWSGWGVGWERLGVVQRSTDLPSAAQLRRHSPRTLPPSLHLTQAPHSLTTR